MAANKIIPFCTTDTGSNLITDADYIASTEAATGIGFGSRSNSRLANKMLRGPSLVTSALAKLAADVQASDVTDSISITQMTAALIAGLRAASGGAACAVGKNTDQGVPANTVTFVTWTGVYMDIDPSPMWSAGAPTRLTVPPWATQARVCAGIVATSVEDASLQAVIWRNRVYAGVVARHYQHTSNAPRTIFTLGSSWMPVAPGDFFEVLLTHNYAPASNPTFGFVVPGTDAQYTRSLFFSLEARR